MMVIGDDDDDGRRSFNNHYHHWRCRGCAVMIIIMIVGDAEDA